MKKEQNNISITEIRQRQAATALDIVKKQIPSAYIGELNESTYYIAVPFSESELAQSLLSDNGIESISEYRKISEDIILHLQDEEPVVEELL